MKRIRNIFFLCLTFLSMAFGSFAQPVHVTTHQADDGSWQLLVDGKPYFIQGVLYTPVKIGEDPSNSTMRDWMSYDDDQDGINDVAYQSWLDVNKNNRKDEGEEAKGDFYYLKEMGVNTIRLYHLPSDNPIVGDLYKRDKSTEVQFGHAVNKTLLRELYNDYGIMVIASHFLGSWTIGSGADWERGTDYTNPEHIESIKKTVKAMVLDNKDEPYILMWLLGNENNLGSWTKSNAYDEPEAYAKLIGELADMIHEIDPHHPVAVCDGDNFKTLHEYARYAQSLDIVAFNSYRGLHGFGSLWKDVKDIFDRPIFISEFGIFSYNTKVGEDEDLQMSYIKNNWEDIVNNSAGHPGGGGNAIGGLIFDWLDRWYMDGTPFEHNPGTRAWQSPDGLRHEEWFGIVSMGDGSDSLMRQTKKTYDYLKDTWNQKISFVEKM